MIEKEKSSEKKQESAPKGMVTLDEVTAESVAEKVFNEKFSDLKKKIETQEKLNWSIVIGVAIAFLFVVGVIIVDVVTSRNLHTEKFDSIIEKIQKNSIQINSIERDVETLQDTKVIQKD